MYILLNVCLNRSVINTIVRKKNDVSTSPESSKKLNESLAIYERVTAYVTLS